MTFKMLFINRISSPSLLFFRITCRWDHNKNLQDSQMMKQMSLNGINIIHNWKKTNPYHRNWEMIHLKWMRICHLSEHNTSWQRNQLALWSSYLLFSFCSTRSSCATALWERGGLLVHRCYFIHFVSISWMTFQKWYNTGKCFRRL